MPQDNHFNYAETEFNSRMQKGAFLHFIKMSPNCAILNQQLLADAFNETRQMRNVIKQNIHPT